MVNLGFPVFLAARLDWGFGNPNKTGALIAMLMIAVWRLAWMHRRLFWLALLLCTALGVSLMQTASRGGIVAAAVGLAILISCAARPWPRPRTAAAVAAVWLVLGVAAWLPTLHRFSKGMGGQDLSILSRMELWRAAPRMMVDAPGGWGLGRSADVFHQWYQPLDHTQLFTSLINSHLTWLVEINWLERFFYVSAWLGVLALCKWRGSGHRQSKWMAVPFSVWIVFAITAWFNSVAESPWLWVLPGLCLAGALWERGRSRRWLSIKTWMSLVLCSGGILAALLVIGLCTHEQPRLRLQGSWVVVGDSEQPAEWLLMNQAVLGSSYGHTLRQYLQEAPGSPHPPAASIGLVDSLQNLPLAAVQAKTLIVCGTLDDRDLARLKTLLPACSKLVLLNPSFFPLALDADSMLKQRVKVVAGEFSQVPVSPWTGALQTMPVSLPGVGDYVPRWPEVIINPLSQTSR